MLSRDDAAMLTNEPPGGVRDPLRERLDEIYVPLMLRAEQLLEAEARVPEVLDERTSAPAGDLARQCLACIRAIDEVHRVEKKPFLDSCRIVDAWRRDLSLPLQTMVDGLRARHNRWQAELAKRERERLAEEAARKAAEAKALEDAGKAASAEEARAEALSLAVQAETTPVSDLVRERTPMAGTLTAREEVHWQITKPTDAVCFLADLIPEDEIERALREWCRRHGGVHGVKNMLTQNPEPILGVKLWVGPNAQYR
jgi:hypothetical protein